MRKVLKGCTGVIRGVIFIGFSVQIVLGILWMFNAFARLHSLGRGIVCVGQIFAAALAVFFFLRCAGGERRRLNLWQSGFAVLAVLTFPMVMQCLTEPDRRVFAAALLLGESGCICGRLCREESGGQKGFPILGACCWLAAGLLLGEYLWLGLFPMLCYIFLERGCPDRGMGFVLGKVMPVLAVGGLIGGIGSFYREPDDFAAVMADRVAWTTLYSDYSRLPEEYRKMIPYDVLTESTYEVTGVKTILVPALEEKLGIDGTRQILWELSAAAWKGSKARIVKEMVWDAAGYLIPATVVPLQLEGRAYDSYTGINYRQLLLPAPRLGKWYMDYGCWWFGTALILRMALWLLTERRVERKALLAAGGTMLFCAIWYALSGAGKMDYKNTMYGLSLWMLWFAPAAFDAAEAGGEDLP